MISLTNNVINRARFTLRGSLALCRFCKIFSPNIGEDQKKSYHVRGGPRHCTIWQIRSWLLHYVHKKVRLGPEIATLKTKPLNFTRVTRINWSAKIELKGPAPLVVIIIVNFCCTHICCTQKMLKETETEETISFFVTFLSSVAFQSEGRGRAPWALFWLRLYTQPPLANRYFWQ